MIARLVTVVERLDRRVHGVGDAAARARGLRVERIGRFGMSRVYRDPRWNARHDQNSA